MDFFEAQDSARKRTVVLGVLFALSLLALTAALYAVVEVLIWQGMPSDGGLATLSFDAARLGWVAAGVAVVVFSGSAWKVRQLRKGGPSVAELLGGRRVAPGTDDPGERRLLNVVEEMSIASGTPVPSVYVMDDEAAINAFAAGHSLEDAAVAVTRGTVERLSRHELQGVIAHEFSHILNGDMRLNIRMLALLQGILVFIILGRGMLRGSAGRRYGSSRSGRNRGGLLFLGVALLLLGSIGLLCGKIIKAAISRQREFLADASAVQFTRNRDGLGGALRKIGGLARGSRIHDHHAEELSHLFFADGVGSRIFATHPPLAQRIHRIDPSFDGEFPELPAEPASAAAAAGSEPASSAAAAGAAGLAGTGARTPTGAESTGRRAPGEPTPPSAPDAAAPAAAEAGVDGVVALLDSAGTPTADHLDYAARLIDSLPTALRVAARDPIGAQAVIFALLRGEESDADAAQRKVVEEYGDEAVADLSASLLPLVRARGPEARLPLLDLALPALRDLESDRVSAFRRAVHALLRADGRVDVFEFALVCVLDRQLDAARGRRPRRGRTLRSFSPVAAAAEIVLSAVAHSGADADETVRAAFRAGVERLPGSAGDFELRPAGHTGIHQVEQALEQLRRGSPDIRKRFLDACGRCIAHDGILRVEEAELLRAVAESLDCPLPPLTAGTVAAA